MPYQVTIANGLKDVVLPNGLRAQGGDVVTLNDREFAQLSPQARNKTTTTLFSSIVATPVLGNESVSSQGVPYLSGWSEVLNPPREQNSGPSSTTTPLSETNNTESLEEG